MIIVHIGLRKAGSASLQNFLYANATALAAQGVDYPEAGRLGGERTAHLNLVHELIGAPKFELRFGTLAELAAHWRASNAQTLIISSEIFERCSREQAARLQKLLQRDGEPFRIALFLRPLADIMASSYGQKVKFGLNTYDFDQFFDSRISEPRVDFFRTARKWASVFGWDSLAVRVLHPDHLHNGNLIDDFLALAGIADEGLVRTPDVNVTPGWQVLEAVRGLFGGQCRLPPEHLFADAAEFCVDQRRMFGSLAMSVGARLGWTDRGQYLTPAQSQRCHAIYAELVRLLNRHVGQALPAPQPIIRDRPFLPSVEFIAADELRAFYDAVALEPASSRAERDEA